MVTTRDSIGCWIGLVYLVTAAMRLFSLLYTKIMLWFRRPHVLIYFAILSFLESSVFPLTACSTHNTMAPVIEGWRQSAHAESSCRVNRGDTLYSIAWRYGLDYRELAKMNHISAPYTLRKGQLLQLVPPVLVHAKSYAKSTDHKNSEITTAVLPQKQPLVRENSLPHLPSTIPSSESPETFKWFWPAQGKVVRRFTGPAGMSKGIDIAGQSGDPVKVATDGKVVYCGSGLKGYGELIIVKHNDEFLSAYAHNRKLLVREGQQLKAGQVIAEMGSSDAPRTLLHFEIRRAGKPVDPLVYLSKK